MRILPLLTVLATCAAVGWRAMLPVDGTGPESLRPYVPYAAEVVVADGMERARFSFDVPPGREYALVVGSLARGDRSFPVRIIRKPGVDGAPLRPLVLPATPARRPPSPLDSVLLEDEPPAAAAADADASSSESALGELRTFHVHVTDGRLDDARHYVPVRARCVRRGRSVRLFLDETLPERTMAAGLCDEITRLLDERFVRSAVAEIGRPLDVDGDGTLAILLTPWLSRLGGGATPVRGFVRPADFRDDVAAPFGGAGDVVYLDAGLRPGPFLEAVLAHELAHVVAISERRRLERQLSQYRAAQTSANVAGNQAIPLDTLIDVRSIDRLPAVRLGEEEDWLNEAIAHVWEAECVSSSPNLGHRVDRFLREPHRAPLVVPDYHAVGRWRDDGCRGATYHFLRWVVETEGPDVLRRLLRSASTGTANVERATGRSFRDLFRRWGCAVGLEMVEGEERVLEIDGTTQEAVIPVHATAHAIVRLRHAGRAASYEIVAPGGANLVVSVVPLEGDPERK